ncbi:TM2 domain-containing protein [Natronobacterium texcoconense]|uniref:Double zinc ribbon n=1 Tax=Natronobacterium texcoconense TaxID=1095778 RepID=A0A1H1AP37_NATTX|nr:TM2 domain-containing protein [Natronobacterium texcoconense]SDQ41485.1 Double zinc ribbon [Natronobacterium texcoconense]
MKHCINCGEEIKAEAELCGNCGVNQNASLEGGHGDRDANEKYCTDCGSLIAKQAEVCPECGVRQASHGAGGSSGSSDKVVASIFALFLGGLGAHKFYQGNVKYGVLYLCFFWTFIPALLAFVEAILMLVSDDAEYEQQYADGSILGKI